MRACDRCRSLRKRCDCRDGVYPCTRCENNGAQCVTTVSPPPTRARSPITAPLQQFFFGEYMDKLMLDTMALWPPGHAALTVTLRFFAGLANTVKAPDKLARILEIAKNAGEDLDVMIATAEAAAAGVVIDTSVVWEDFPHGQQHLQSLPRNDNAPDTCRAFATHFTSNSLKVWCSKGLSDWLYDGPVEMLPQWKLMLAQPWTLWGQVCEQASYINICKGFVHLVNASSQYNLMRTVSIQGIRFNDNTLVDCFMSIVYASDSVGIFFMEMLKPSPPTPEIIPLSESKDDEVDPIALDSQWQLCEEDISLFLSSCPFLEE